MIYTCDLKESFDCVKSQVSCNESSQFRRVNQTMILKKSCFIKDSWHSSLSCCSFMFDLILRVVLILSVAFIPFVSSKFAEIKQRDWLLICTVILETLIEGEANGRIRGKSQRMCARSHDSPERDCMFCRKTTRDTNMKMKRSVWRRRMSFERESEILMQDKVSSEKDIRDALCLYAVCCWESGRTGGSGSHCKPRRIIEGVLFFFSRQEQRHGNLVEKESLQSLSLFSDSSPPTSRLFLPFTSRRTTLFSWFPFVLSLQFEPDYLIDRFACTFRREIRIRTSSPHFSVPRVLLCLI